MRWDSFKKGGSRDWRVGVVLLTFLAISIAVNVATLRGDFGPHAQRGAKMFWGLR